MQDCSLFSHSVEVRGLDDLSSGVQQNGIGVWPGPEDAITVVEVVVECLRYLEGVVIVLVLMFFCYGLWRVPLSTVVQVRISEAAAVVLLGLHRNQGRGQS